MPSQSGVPLRAPAAPGALPDAAAALIAEGRVARLATADAEGQPLVVPICYAWDGAALFSAIDAKPKAKPAESLKRIRNIKENDKVCVVVDRYDEDWRALRYAIVQGRARLLTGGPDFTRGADLLLAKYPQYREMRLGRDSGLMIKVEVEKVTHWAFSGEGERD